MTVKVGLVSLGCPKNLVDSEVILGLLKDAGYEITNSEQDSEVLIVNTCSFINDAKEESIGTIIQLARLKEGGNCRALLVTGCMAQRYSEELLAEMPEIDALIGTGFIADIPGIIRRVLAGEKVILVGAPGYLHTFRTPKIQITPRHTAYLKIAEGCNNHCSYCVIPTIRGDYRSRNIEDILNEATRLVQCGVKELILVAQDTTLYGIDLYGKPVLYDLIKRLATVKGLVWLRLLYTYPALLTDELVCLMSTEEKLCRYLDIPLQHAGNNILKKMNRRNSREEIVGLVKKLRSSVPGITLRTSFIVGFPGETDKDFQELLNFISELKFDRVGAFTYSREEGTAAAELPGQVPEEIKQERYNRIMALQQKISLENNIKKIGKVITVLTEEHSLKKRGVYRGRSEGDAPDIDGKVIFKTNLVLQPGEVVKVLIKDAREYDLSGELVQ